MIDQEIQDLMITNEEWDSMRETDGTGVDTERFENCSWILGVSTAGHGGSICLMRDNQVVFFLKEERTSRKKRDAKFPFRSVQEVKKYTDTLCLVVFLNMGGAECTSFVRQLGKENIEVKDWIDPGALDQTWRYLYGSSHHINHASCGYHLSPFRRFYSCY